MSSPGHDISDAFLYITLAESAFYAMAAIMQIAMATAIAAEEKLT
jgi:hypothetical protein